MNYEIWKYEQGFNKVYVDKIEAKEKILLLEGCRLHCTYYKKGNLKAWDIIYPVSYDKLIVKILRKFDKN